MATTKKATEEQTEENMTAETQSEEPAPEAQAAPEQTSEEAHYVLPPTLLEAGLAGVVGVTAGQYSVPSGSYFAISPGQAYTVSQEDAAALIDQGAAVALADINPPVNPPG